MKVQTFVEYELVDPVSNQYITTESYGKAIDSFEKGWLVYEHHNTVTIPSPFVSTREVVSVKWNENPYYEV